MEDPDRDWKPSGRPQSTIARNFSAELDSLFKTDGDLDTLDRTVHQKKQIVSTHTQELEALEAKLRETEERLNKAKTSPTAAFSRKNSQRRTPIQGTFAEADKARTSESNSPLSQSENTMPGSMPGAMPETPQSHNGRDYVMVDRHDDHANGDAESVRPQP
ncbi:uncharacterized protein BDZ99DRAFT_389336 [Mytilinidion resinicola]|uniref:Uncharacterized protein n=1 Tax=Mytilinidion resinicola TaxID=574789 RepID=A0A6A6YIS3_9PEZI|nr:uncharacterized protein BDZ99DRAFT_389336 [Mytilinidion resinicola]KAF2808690.1 hypothetical protein BDZ99DRAFT_389336 [Mytilinidion resinicola]